MSSLEPLINLLIVLTVLSVAAERVTNLLKLRNKDLRVEHKHDEGEEKDREHRIAIRSIIVGVAVAIIAKANLFEILNSLDAPWQTLGWMELADSKWSAAAVLGSTTTTLYAVLGSVVTGVALGFGSKFWHEMLDGVLELKGVAKGLNEKYRG